jgi:hypothetical protein
MEDAINDAVDGSVWIDSLVVPALHELRNYPLKDLRGDFACWFIEDLLLSIDDRVKKKRGGGGGCFVFFFFV